MILLLALLACSTQPSEPVVPYSPEECALAAQFDEACWRLSYGWTDEEGLETQPPPGTLNVYQIVERRKALGVSANRRWWCTDPSNANDYHHTAYFTPPLENGCGSTAPTP